MFASAVVVSLILVSLFLFIGWDACARARTRKLIEASNAEADDEEAANPMIPITVVEAEPAACATYLGLSAELARPWFNTRAAIFDDDTVVYRKVGPN